MKLPVTKKPLLKLLVLLSLLGTAVACGIKKDSPAPGCVEYWRLAPVGGLFWQDRDTGSSSETGARLPDD